MSREDGTTPCDVAQGIEAEAQTVVHQGQRETLLHRRDFLRKAAVTGAAISALDFLSYFNAYGAPQNSKATEKSRDKAKEGDDPHFLIYWYKIGRAHV